MLLKIPATRTPQGALKCVALIIKILSCNKTFFFMVYDQNYHNCSTLAPSKKIRGGGGAPPPPPPCITPMPMYDLNLFFNKSWAEL
jgi:hypothetical protein